jgi:protein arginine N-methyltransferase 1
VFTFDLTTLKRDQLPRRFSTSKPVKRAAQRDGICMYFKAIFVNEIAFSTGPDAVKTHWPMLFYRTPAQAYQPGESLSIEVEVADLSYYLHWSWRVGAEAGERASRQGA